MLVDGINIIRTGDYIFPAMALHVTTCLLLGSRGSLALALPCISSSATSHTQLLPLMFDILVAAA
jgi:hypothetical protein